jgi:hypothetical protein
MAYQFNPFTGQLDVTGGGGGGNPFDQNLNTTNNVAFSRLNVNNPSGSAYLELTIDPTTDDQVWQMGIGIYGADPNRFSIANANLEEVLGIVGSACVIHGSLTVNGTINATNINSAASLNATNVVQLTSTQTLTNKTLTNPNIGNGTTFAKLTADSADILAVANSTTACSFKVYNTKTDASNYEAGIFDWKTNTNALTIGTAKLGTGTARRVRLDSAENIDFYVNAGTRVFQCASNGITAFSTFGWQMNTAAADPTTSSTPFSNGTNYVAVYKNTTTGVVSLWVRDGTTMKKAILA